ncbi:Flp family type IVb pilin [Afifella sp. IM 167]|uniref:Flp family type IVb pilin n=1 Tax=Afifella sp. IM 167 TaxID=2033586 RepID=UPI001CCFE517|nr:Flp family type IVb pilin [Afifella sp. IM 167]MBZ8133015.1 Flp family type IVb pilin [Afifella sp. IM 167]
MLEVRFFEEFAERYLRGESGATAVEYALICGILMVALIGILGVSGATSGLYDVFQLIIDAISGEG